MLRPFRHLPALVCAGLLLARPAAAQGPDAAALDAAAAPSTQVLRLRNELRSILHAPGWRDARFGVLVVSLDRGDTLFALEPDAPLEPASNLKLYTTAAALYYLGPAYRFSTFLLAGGPVHDGVLEGDLVLYGTGDPTISGRMLESTTSTFRAFADTLAALGVHEVRGNVVGDGSYFTGQRLGAGWLPTDLDEWYAAPVSGLDHAENMVTVRIAGGTLGEGARVTTVPATRGLALENRVRTVRHGSTRIHFERAEDRLIVSGQIRRGRVVTRSLPVVDPANYAAAGLRAVLEEHGIEVTGSVRTISDPARSPMRPGAAPPRIVATHLSPTLAEIVSVTNHVSHNLFAEALLRAAGRAAAGDGSVGGGARAVGALLARAQGADTAALHLVDGSGLSTLDHTTPGNTVALLDYLTGNGIRDAYLASLPEAGNEHGLRRMYDSAAAGNLRAKTGTIHGVSALSGYVTTADGEHLVFSIMANGVPSTAREKASEDAIGERLAEFSR